MSDPDRCAVCSQPLPPREGMGPPRKVCRDEDSPTPGGCARWRNNEKRHRTHAERPPGSHQHRRSSSPWHVFPNGGFIIE